MLTQVKPRGKFIVEHIRDGKVIGVHEAINGIVNEGANKELDIMFRNQTNVATWYIGLIDNAGSPSLAAGDTHASHAGWNEYSSYSDGTRQAWGTGAASGRAITNASPAVFNFTGTATIYGIFLSNQSVKGNASGSFTIWATAAFAAPVALINGDQLKVTYTVSM